MPHKTFNAKEELMNLIKEGHETVINHEEVGQYELKVENFITRVEEQAREEERERIHHEILKRSARIQKPVLSELLEL